MSRAGLRFSPATSPGAGAAGLSGGDYERLAPWYSLLERLVLGSRQQRCRVHLLGQLRQARRVLIVGEGPGKTLLELLRVNPRCHVDVLEPSPAMVHRARHRLCRVDPGLTRRVTFHQARWEDWPGSLAARYHAMILPFLMDLLASPRQQLLAERLRGLCGPGSCCLINDFNVTHRDSMLQRCLYGGARWTTGLDITELADYGAAMRAAHWHLAREAASGSDGCFLSQIWIPA
jgi:SAM-dependent methyltransferase